MASPAYHHNVLVERAGPEDVDRVMAIMDAAFGTAFGEAWTRSQLTGILPMAGIELVVARIEPGSTIAGFSLSRTIVDEAELLLIAVDPAVQRQGTGSLLVDHFIDRAKADGVRRVHLEVRDGNPAQAIYRSRSFEAVGRRRDYYRGHDRTLFDAITLSRILQ